MHIGKRVLVRHGNKVQEGIVINIFPEDLEIKLDNETVIMKKFWEVGKVDYDS